MKNIWNIFSTDVRKTGTNWVALIILGGLLILPSLYAWLNIKAAWDPYSQVDEVPVGIVNEDVGAEVRGEDIHVGDELISTLKEDNSMNWQFDNREGAMEHIENGDYYAVIIIPEDFSEKLGTVTTGNPEKANVEYYVNEKVNAITPQMTNRGASTIVDNVSSQFVSTVNGVIFDLFNQIGVQLENDLPDIERFEEYLFNVEKSLPEIEELLTSTLTDAENAADLINEAQGLIPRAEETTNDGLNTIDNTIAFLDNAEGRLNEMAPQIQEDLETIQQVTQSTNDFLQDVQDSNIDFGNGNAIVEQVDTQINDGLERLTTIEDALNQVQEQLDPEQPEYEQIQDSLDQIVSLRESLENVQTDANEINTVLQNTEDEVSTLLNDLKERSQTVNEQVDAFVVEYTDTIEPTVRQTVDEAKGTLQEARGILVDIQSTIPEVESILASTDGNLQEGTDTINTVLGEFPYVNTKVNELADRVREIQDEADLQEIIDLLQNDPEAEQSFFQEPVTLDETQVFPIANYGAGMTPFYTVLAIWVGGLLLISLLSTEVHHVSEFTLRQEYFGKLMTFLLIGIIQTIIITFGDIFILGVEMAHPGWFILFGLFISFIFITIIYTLVSVFGDVGKAMVIVFLVLQIAGSGGTYPAMLLPEFFQTINPFLPFTYAIDLLREAVGGIIWSKAIKDMLVLALFGSVFFALGAFFKQPINKHTRKLAKKSRESGLFH
ncbi:MULTISPECIES: YhgE/Pip domain-containing protein [Oceanobacillus]|uniref:Phage infection protein n=1 Tax=Oceanobacillus kimchii TaxID=746691 RepID=A0ABQ5TKK6_9BACI|nr:MULTISPECIES: YhgE/Pip domain-containing protein [Oceanobacillus]MBT2600339.1 YhgE/Pip domain-containing protein [Oceanobacillus sp. ISL-74]MBT2650497.1 YhgE/Pip domain-containing protein [Oceanobacillus sp. ISL-73]GLO67388.1 phage infection protein [Oceanobacillus kimchii]